MYMMFCALLSMQLETINIYLSIYLWGGGHIVVGFRTVRHGGAGDRVVGLESGLLKI
jgi:hypothetical protein